MTGGGGDVTGQDEGAGAVAALDPVELDVAWPLTQVRGRVGSKRRPGDSIDFGARRYGPNADLLGTQFGSGGSSGFAISLYRLIRHLFDRRGHGCHL